MKCITEAMVLNELQEVGEHSNISEAIRVSGGGEVRKANVGISNDKAGEKPAHRKTKVS